MTPEIKAAFEEATKTLHDIRGEVDALKGKSADVVDNDRLAKAEADLAAKLDAEQEARNELKERIDAFEAKSNRPGLPGAGGEQKDAYELEFDGFARKGVEPKAESVEYKGMTTTVQEDGGFLVPNAMREGIQKRLRRSNPMRELATIVNFDGGSYDILVERGDAGYEWGGETQAPNETGTPTVNRISIPTHELSAMPKASQRMLDNATFDLGAWLIERVSDRFARAEETAFVSGNGVNKPKGILSYSYAADADADRAAETFQFRSTGASGDFAATGPADVFTKIVYDLQGQYQSGASWLMKNLTAAKVATLKDGNGAYLLQSMLNADGTLLRTIHGRPVYLADDMPAIAANSLSVLVGDFSAGYTIVDGVALRVLRDPFSSKPHVLFYATKRVGGGANDFDAIKAIKFAA